MSQKQMTAEEISEIIGGIFSFYTAQYDKMSFSEMAIVENILIKLQWEFDKKFKELCDDE